jgi:hypothetical protein
LFDHLELTSSNIQLAHRIYLHNFNINASFVTFSRRDCTFLP